MNVTKLLEAVTATGAGTRKQSYAGTKTYSASGRVTATTGAVTVQFRGTNNGGASYDVIGTITLALTVTGGTDDASDSFTSNDRYFEVDAKVTSISGTNAQVSAAMGF